MALTGSVHPMRVMSPIDGARDSGELHGGVKADGRTAKTVFGSTDVRYQMRQRLISIGDDFTISDQEGNAAFKVDGKALRVRETLILQDLDGNDLCKIQARMLRVRDTMEIEDGDGNSAATVKKALISPFRDRFHVEIANGPALEVKGNIVEHNYASSATARRSPRFRRSGSASRTATASRSRPGRTTRLFSQSPWHLITWPIQRARTARCSPE